METGALRKRSKSNPEARSPQEQAKQVAREGSMVVSSTYEETKERESARADRQILESSEKQVLPRIFPDLDPLSPAAIEAGNQLGRALLEARQNAVLNSQSRFMEPGSSSDGKMEYMVVTTPEEKVEFAVVFAERVADVLDYHQQDAVENNIKNLLSSVETIGRFRILFLRGMESIQQFPIAMNSCDSHDFLRGVEFGKNYLRHIKSRTYRDRFGEDVATGTAPSTPGIRGWLYFANGKKIRKDQGYGNELVEEALRLGMENAVFPARSPTYQGSFLTPQRVENIKFREDQEQQFLTGDVILGFGERDDELAFPEQSLSEEMPVADKNPVPETTRAPWLQQAGRHFKAMTGRLTENDLSGPYATSGEMSTGSGYPVLAGQPSYPHSGYQPVSQNRQQELPAASPSYSCNFAFAEQLVKVRAVSGESYLPFDQTQRYGSAGSYGLTGSAPQYGSGGNCLQSDQMQPYTGSGGYAQDSQSSRYESGGGYPQDHNKRYGSLREYAQISHSRRHESVGQRELGYQTGTRGIHSSQGLQGQQDDRTCKQENYPFRSKGSKKQNRKNKKHADSTQVPAADAKGKGKGKWPQPSGSH